MRINDSLPAEGSAIRRLPRTALTLTPCLPEAVAGAAALYIADRIREKVGAFHLALSGGRSPGKMLSALATLDLPWQRVHVWQVDEREAPDGDVDRNWTMIQAALGVPAMFHPMPVHEPDGHRRYAWELAANLGDGGLDLVHLGLGTDGHTASIIPGDATLRGPVSWTKLYQGRRRLTLTLPTINRARKRMWLITGVDKTPMLRRLIAGDGSIPGGLVSRESTAVFTDAMPPLALT